VLAVGNPSRGDDAVGPLLAARLEAAVATGAVGPQVEVLCDAQLMVEHALDVIGRAAVVFVDAAAGDPGQVRFGPVRPARDGLMVSTHACPPPQLLRLVEETLGAPSPPASLLSVGGRDFELGAPVHEQTALAIEVAWRRLLVELRRLGVTIGDGAAVEVDGA
jgi:hydrogenase maturation protease